MAAQLIEVDDFVVSVHRATKMVHHLLAQLIQPFVHEVSGRIMRPAPRGTSLPLHVQQVQHSVSSIRRASYLFGRKTGDRQAVATALGKLLRRALEALVREEAASRR